MIGLLTFQRDVGKYASLITGGLAHCKVSFSEASVGMRLSGWGGIEAVKSICQSAAKALFRDILIFRSDFLSARARGGWSVG